MLGDVEEQMATLEQSRPQASVEHLQRFERKLREASRAIARLPGDDYYAQLQKIIRRPGWTTVAEGIFFESDPNDS